jgi:CheY-like chemotaxis protein
MTDAQPRLILIIEDDNDLASTLADAVEMHGYRVGVAANGREGIELLRTGERPDAILLDMMMPVMNGWEFREAQLAMDEVASIPVIAVTADGRANEKANEISAAGVLTKPVRIANLMHEITRVAGPPQDA